jgi:uncharacterized membrane protein
MIPNRARMSRLIAALCLVLWALPVAAQDFPALYRVTGVAANDVLNIRAEPSAQADIIGSYLPGQAGIEVIAVTADGRWAMVNMGEWIGWSATRYLARQSPGSWMDGDQQLTCFGTEPFWQLTAFLPGSQAEYFTPDNGGVNLVTDAGTLPRTQFPPTLAIPFSGAHQGMAVLRPDACNDGMSDRSFGIAAQVYFRGRADGLSGCCSLAR